MDENKLLNKKGQTEEEFLKAYNPGKYERPSVTVDMLIFAKTDEKEQQNDQLESMLQLLMIKRGDHPYLGQWALPGGFVNMDESLETAACRELKEETGLDNIYMEQLYTWGDVGRDPRTRVISTSFMTLVDRSRLTVKADDDADDAKWFTIFWKSLSEKNTTEKDAAEKDNTMKDKDSSQKLYGLKLTCGDVEISAVINIIKTMKGNMEKTDWSIVSSNGIAFDHAKIIAYALKRFRSNPGWA